MKTKFFFTDIDGVWTDNGMYYSDNGSELKKFHTSDSVGVLLLKMCNIETVIITGESNSVVKRRADKLNIKKTFLGVKNKLKVARSFCEKHKLNLFDQAFIGDEINDIHLLKSVTHSYCPKNAASYVSQISKFQLETKGGEGAFKEAVIHFLNMHNLYETAFRKLLNSYEGY